MLCYVEGDEYFIDFTGLCFYFISVNLVNIIYLRIILNTNHLHYSIVHKFNIVAAIVLLYNSLLVTSS